MLGGFLAGVVLCVFLYFVYRRVQASRDKKAGSGSGGGRSGRQVEK